MSRPLKRWPKRPDYELLTLDELRKRRGLTQRSLAARIGVSPSVACHYEASVDPRLSTLDAVITALGGQLAILAVFREPDGTITRHLVRTPDDPKRQMAAEFIDAPRHADPKTSRPAREGREARLAAQRETEAADV